MPRRGRLAFYGAGAGVALLAVTWYAVFHIGVVKHADQSILRGFADLHRPRVDQVTQFIADLCNPKPYVFFAAVPVLVALARRRPRVAVAVGVILLGANVTTQVLKPLLAQARPTSVFGEGVSIAPASWPSGHATAAMSLALCCVLAAPARLRPFVVALGAAFAVAVCYSFLELGWHYPSDVLGGFLVATTWTLIGVGALFALDARHPRRAPAIATSTVGTGPAAEPVSIREALAPSAVALLAGLALAGLVALARPHAVITYARTHEAFMVGAAGIAALGLALSTGVMLALRR